MERLKLITAQNDNTSNNKESGETKPQKFGKFSRSYHNNYYISGHRKYTRCFVVFCGILSFLLLLYIPAYNQVQSRIVGIPGWEYNTSRDMRSYVMPDNVTAVHEPHDLCVLPSRSVETTETQEKQSKQLLLLIIVCSAVENFAQRDAIRNTWAADYGPDNSVTRVAFLLGLSENETLQYKVDNESMLYNDVIQERFRDSYNNLTLKSVMMLKWINTYCSGNTKFIMKTDDDMYVNVPELVKLLRARPNSKEILMGSLICGARPIADTKSKWYSPKYMFEGRVYPNYLSGTGYVMSADASEKLYRAALQTPIFHLEDVYITGICSREASIKPRNHPSFNYQQRKFDPCVYRNIVTSHKVSPDKLYKMYSLLRQQEVIQACIQREMASTTSTEASLLPANRFINSVRLRSRKRKVVVGKKARNNCS